MANDGAQLKINIVADGSQAITTLKSVGNAVANTQKATKDGAQTFAVYNNALNVSSGYAKQQAQAATAAASANKQLATAATDSAKAMDKASTSSRGMLEPLNNAYNVIRKIAYALPGIGVSGIFGLIGGAITSAIESVGSSTKVIDDAAKAVDAYKKTVDGVIDSNKKEAATVDILVQKIQSGTLSREQTVTAIKELQKIAPDYFGKLDAETAKISDVTKAYTAYNNEIIRTIESQIRIAEVTDLVRQRLAAQQATPEASKFITDLQAQGKTLDQIGEIVRKANSENIRSQALLLQGEKYVSDEKLKQAILDSKVPGGVEQILNLLQKESDLIKQINNADITQIVKTKAEKPEDDTLRHVALVSPITFLTTNLDENFKVLQTKIDKHPMSLKFTFDKKDLTDVTELIKGELVKFSESIGNAIGSGQNVFKAAGKSLLSGVGDLIESLGKSMIELANIRIIIDNIGFTNPYVELAAGVAATIAGAALKASASSQHNFATGGVATGPTLGLVGEAGPEAIVPLNQLSSFAQNASGSSQQVHGTFRINGNDLKLVLARANKNQGLV